MLGPKKRPTRNQSADSEGPQRRQPDAGVQQPRCPPRPRRHAEFEGSDRAARAHHARELVQRGQRIVDVAQQVGERERVELRVGERQPLRLPADELDPCGELGVSGELRARGGEHILALVHADDRAPVGADELLGHQAGASRDVEHAVLGDGVDPRDEGAPPARILAEAEQRADAIVVAPEAREELQRAHRSRGGAHRRRRALRSGLERGVHGLHPRPVAVEPAHQRRERTGKLRALGEADAAAAERLDPHRPLAANERAPPHPAQLAPRIDPCDAQPRPQRRRAGHHKARPQPRADPDLTVEPRHERVPLPIRREVRKDLPHPLRGRRDLDLGHKLSHRPPAPGCSHRASADAPPSARRARPAPPSSLAQRANTVQA